MMTADIAMMSMAKPLLRNAAILAIASVFVSVAGPKITFSSDTVLSTDIDIAPGVTCIVKPGVTVRFEGYRTFLVRGVLLAEGTGAEPIVFTAINRDRGSREKPAWKGFEFIGREAQGMLRHCRIEGAFRNLVWGSNPVFDSCEFAGNHYGLYCTRKAAPHVKNSLFKRNTYGIASDFAAPLLLDNIIRENNVGLYLQLCSRAIAGRNRIESNTTDIRSEESMGENRGSVSLHTMWRVMQQLY
jgi:hypothetical protein